MTHFDHDANHEIIAGPAQVSTLLRGTVNKERREA
jgi:hypothetical protein